MKKPVVLIIMDGVGKGDGGSGDAVAVAKTPTLDRLFDTCPYTWLKAHGTAVGLPSDDDMGNSEVGHNALGCGQVYSQGAKLVGESIENGTLLASLLPKSITTAMGIAISEQLGGVPAVTTAVIIITGILGNICGSSLCRLLKIREPIAQGVAFGTASHVVGTSRASEISELTGAVSSLSLVVAGILTAIACPVLYSVL